MDLGAAAFRDLIADPRVEIASSVVLILGRINVLKGCERCRGGSIDRESAGETVCPRCLEKPGDVRAVSELLTLVPVEGDIELEGGSRSRGGVEVQADATSLGGDQIVQIAPEAILPEGT